MIHTKKRAHSPFFVAVFFYGNKTEVDIYLVCHVFLRYKQTHSYKNS